MEGPALTPDQLNALARTIVERARTGRNVHLTPATALVVARVLALLSERPLRFRLSEAICGLPKCYARRDCISCTLKANAIEGVIRDEWAVLVRTLSKK